MLDAAIVNVTAREQVRVAHPLIGLPEISGAFETGRLSYSKVRALTRASTRKNEGSLLRFALSTTASRIEERRRQLRNVEPLSSARAAELGPPRRIRYRTAPWECS